MIKIQSDMIIKKYMLKFRNALGAKSPTIKGDFLKSGT